VLFARIAAAVVGFPLLPFLFGWSVLGRVAGLDRTERFTAAWAVGYAFLAAVEFLAFLTRAPQPWFHLGVLVLMLAATAFLWRRPQALATAEFWPLAGGWALSYGHLLLVQALLPHYVGSDWWGDWHMHYQEAQVFLGRLPVDTEWVGAGRYTLASRTPLFNLAAAFLLSVVGDDFWAFQVADAALNCCWVPAVYLLLRELFGVRAARLGLLLAPLNVWLLHNAWFTWPKMLAAYFLVLALYCYLRWLRQRPAGGWFLACWLCGLLGFLTHQVAAVYLLVLVLHAAALLAPRRATWPRLRDLTLLPATALLLVAPWYAWLFVQFGVHKVFLGTPVTQMEEQAQPPLAYLGAVAYNLFASVVPVDLWEALWAQPRTWDEIYRGLTALYFSLLPGALTVSLSLFLVAALVRAGWSGLRRPAWSATWAFVLLGGLGAALLHPRACTHGIAHAALFPSVLVLAALAWGRLSQAPRAWTALVCAGMVVEFAAPFWSHVYLTAWPEVLDLYPYNLRLKAEHHLLFLADGLAPVRPVVIAGALTVQLALAGLLAGWLSRPGPERLQNPGGGV
jgi:4-amino-4-deoxy-L-arabinose transferase-like glycosyltransferase